MDGIWELGCRTTPWGPTPSRCEEATAEEEQPRREEGSVTGKQVHVELYLLAGSVLDGFKEAHVDQSDEDSKCLHPKWN